MEEKTVDEYLEELKWPPSLEKKLREYADGRDALDFSDLSEFIRRLNIHELGLFYQNIPEEWSGWSVRDFERVGVGNFGYPPKCDQDFCYSQLEGRKGSNQNLFSFEYEASQKYEAAIPYPSLETKYVLLLFSEIFDIDKYILVARSLINGGERKTVVRFCGSSLPLRLGVESIREDPSNLTWLLSEVTKKNLDPFFPESGMMNIYPLLPCNPYSVHFEPIDIKIKNAERELEINTNSEIAHQKTST